MCVSLFKKWQFFGRKTVNSKRRSSYLRNSTLLRFQRLLFVPLTLVDGEMKKDPERSRSVVIQGIPESKAPVPSVRGIDDFNPIRDISDIVDFLCIICSTISVFHMGCFDPSRPRLSKGLYRRVFC